MPPAPVVLVRYWAAARSAAGVASEQRAGATVGQVADGAVADHPELARLLTVATLLLDGRAVPPDTPVSDGAVLEILPPFAGG